ncbi:MAG: hypothetical protein KJO07_00760 [Deltaproteobacteria bacterium]|nr:hypothetical protein [Deltaproteobacteria bacterium]
MAASYLVHVFSLGVLGKLCNPRERALIEAPSIGQSVLLYELGTRRRMTTSPIGGYATIELNNRDRFTLGLLTAVPTLNDA